MSAHKEIRDMGVDKADDLISTMMYDHEQASSTPRSTSIPSTIPPESSIEKPTTSLVSRLWRSRTVSEDMIVQPGVLAIKKSHWKPTDVASKCADAKCRNIFTARDRRRNCAMCGKVYCFHCTNYRRRLSTNSRPDPLGQFHTVCLVCFNYSDAFGGNRDHMREFQSIRRERANLIMGSEVQEKQRPLCQRRDTPTKRKTMLDELHRLIDGYQANQGVMKGWVAEMVVPEWQKSADWVPSKKATSCTNCGAGLNVMKRKIHCRIGGQVFCSNCVGNDLILYFDEAGKVKWALNGKDGILTKEPEKFQLLTVCLNCSTVLHSVLIEEFSAPPPPVFLETLEALHSQLSKMQAKVDSTLPGYTHLVECMDMTDNSPSHVEERHPMRKLIKTQSDLSDAFSSLAVESQKLKQMKPTSRTQEKLLRNVMLGMYRFYSENMFSFRSLKNHLAEIIPMETLGAIQAMLSMQTMERCHVVIQHLIYEALKLDHQYKFDNKFFTPIIDVTNTMDVEFKEFVEERNEDWEEHCKLIMEFIEKEMKNNHPLFKIHKNVLKQGPQVIHYVVVSQCSSIIHECYRDIQAKTIDREFGMVKEKLHSACEQLDMILLRLNSEQL